MAVTAHLYGQFFGALTAGDVDLDGDSLYAMLTDSTYVPDQDTHEFLDDVTGEVAGAGYTAGGQALTGITWTYTADSNTWSLDADDLSWPASTIVARRCVVYDRTPATDATRRLIGWVDFGADVSTTGGTLTVAWAAGGIATVAVS